ncbi:class I SAM-dependent methyltransferase [Sulfurovum sp. ST-21]|uniref:Class I SAM-dependent methyltransferase n=1 Tax=Sulfurovum indicum TaxID=2779528 RepID=A0A7M1S0L9_9BACT|nr:class I SAM-dependent methyltransferase [Sulfurovum indicum]QOR61053.1 class I SAM-dependent methyltransferase [Sulfurovum indicum]
MECHICDGAVESFVDGKTDISYYHCHTCEYLFKSPECYQGIEEQKARYDLHENDENDEGYRAYFQRFLDFVLPLVGEPENGFDFGCGKSTLLADILNNIGVVCDYYDPIYHPDLPDNSKKYELIVSTEVFEHLHDPRSVFSSLAARLKEGGYLAIQTQFHPNDRVAFREWYYHKDPTHIVFFRPKTFQVLAERFGCKVLADNGKNMIVLKKQTSDRSGV